MEINATLQGPNTIYSIQFIDTESQHTIPAPIVRVHTCGLLTIEVLQEIVSTDPPRARYKILPADKLHGRGIAPALTLLKLLAGQLHRYGPKDWLLEHVGRDDEATITEKRLGDIVSMLRGLLCPEDKDELRTLLVSYVHGSRGSGDGYRLADFPLVWLDVDALAWHVDQAARMERFGDEHALQLWERAYQLASRGVYLADEVYSEWAQERREQVEGYYRLCVHALRRLYLARWGEAGEAQVELLLQTYWRGHHTDEDALRPLMEILCKQERYQEALAYYEQLEAALEEAGLTKKGQKRVPDERTRELAEYARTKQLLRERTAANIGKAAKGNIIAQAAPMSSQQNMPSYSSLDVAQAIIVGTRELEGQDMDTLRRRILQQALGITNAALVAPGSVLLNSDIMERLQRALAKPSTVDETTLRYLEYRTDSYWQDRNSAALASSDLLSYVIEHLQKVLVLLEGSLLPEVRTRICSITGTTTLLVGALLYD